MNLTRFWPRFLSSVTSSLWKKEEQHNNRPHTSVTLSHPSRLCRTSSSLSAPLFWVLYMETSLQTREIISQRRKSKIKSRKDKKVAVMLPCLSYITVWISPASSDSFKIQPVSCFFLFFYTLNWSVCDWLSVIPPWGISVQMLMEFSLLLKIQCCWLGGMFGKESERKSERSCVSFKERERSRSREQQRGEKKSQTARNSVLCNVARRWCNYIWLDLKLHSTPLKSPSKD